MWEKKIDQPVEFRLELMKQPEKLLAEFAQATDPISRMSFEISMMAECSGKPREFFLEMPLPELAKYRKAFTQYVTDSPIINKLLFVDKEKERLIENDLIPHSPNQRKAWILK